MYKITQEQKAVWDTAVRYNKSSHEKCDQIKLSNTNIPIHKRPLHYTATVSQSNYIQTHFKHTQIAFGMPNTSTKTNNTKTEGTRKHNHAVYTIAL
jgi:hypothetical protein